MKVTGMNGAQAMTMELEVLTGTNSGASWLADENRTPTFGAKTAPTHSDVIDYLAIGGRDISPNKEDANKSGQIITDKVAEHLKKTGRITKDGQQKPTPPPEKRAKAGLAAGLRDGARYNAAQMTGRIEGGKTNSGGKAKQVSQEDGGAYARRRKKEYNVAESVVYVASTQLADALIKGKVKVFLTDADVSRFT